MHTALPRCGVATLMPAMADTTMSSLAAGLNSVLAGRAGTRPRAIANQAWLPSLA
jgi:hypothetical protein